MWAAVMTLPKLALDTEILQNTKVGDDVYALTVHGRVLVSQAQPGQFIHLQIPAGNVFLRRPFGIADTDEGNGRLTMYYRVAGKGTRALTGLQHGDIVNCLGPLGNGFSLSSKRPLLVGGGMGLAPLLFLAKSFQGDADVLMDFNHPMAGKVLHFTGTILSMRDATEKELAEGLHGEFLPPEERPHCCHGKGRCHHGEGEKGHCHHGEGKHGEGECCHGDGEKDHCCHHEGENDGHCCRKD